MKIIPILFENPIPGSNDQWTQVKPDDTKKVAMLTKVQAECVKGNIHGAPHHTAPHHTTPRPCNATPRHSRAAPRRATNDYALLYQTAEATRGSRYAITIRPHPAI